MGPIALLLACWSFDWVDPADGPQGVPLQTQDYATFLTQ